MNPQISALEEDHGFIGYSIAKALMQDPFLPQEYFFHYSFLDRESTGGAYVTPQTDANNSEEELSYG